MSSAVAKTSKYSYRSSGSGGHADVSIEYSADLSALSRLEVGIACDSRNLFFFLLFFFIVAFPRVIERGEHFAFYIYCYSTPMSTQVTARNVRRAHSSGKEHLFSVTTLENRTHVTSIHQPTHFFANDLLIKLNKKSV